MGRYGKGRAFQSAYLLNRDASAFFMTFNAYKGDSGVHRDIVPSMLQTYKNMVEYRVESYELSKSSGTTDDQMKEVGEIIPTSSDYKFLEMSKGEQYHWMHDYMSQFQDAITYDSIDRHREVTGVTISSHSHQFLRP